MGKLLLTIITTLVTYYLLMIGIVKASAISMASSPEFSDAQKESYMENVRSSLPVSVGFTINGNSRSASYPFRNTMGASTGLRQSIGGEGPRSKVPIEMDLLVDDDDLYLYDKSKRYDDYGHMRFGKRSEEEHFDDYGHMRFGKKSKLN